MNSEPDTGRPTIADVARAAGVSKTTVSHALGGVGRVNEKTRRRVLEVAQSLQYRPSMMAQGLRTGRGRLIAIVNSIPAAISTGAGELSYFMTAASSAARTALERGYATILIPPSSQEAWLGYIDIEGAVIMDPLAGDGLLRTLLDRNIPVVTTGRDPDDTAESWWVDTDSVASTEMLLDHLWACGASRPALILPKERRSISVDTLESYTRWIGSRGLPSMIALAREDGAEEAGRLATIELITRFPDVDAILAPLDAFATGALRALEARGLSVPGDVQITTQDGVRAKLSVPPLTALNDFPAEIGEKAIKLLLERIENPDLPPKHEIVVPKLMIRKSTRL